MALNFLQGLFNGGAGSIPPPLDLSQLEPWMRIGLQGAGMPPSVDMSGAANLAPSALAAPPENVMQAAAMPPSAPEAAPAPVASAPAKAPIEGGGRQRLSLIDTVGRLADVFARVGGAEALYQPTIDQRDDRKIAFINQQREVDLDGLRRTLLEQQVGAGTDEASERGNERVGAAVRGLQAIQRAGGDINAAWPLLARQAGIPEERATALGQIFTANPNVISGFAATLTGENPEFGVQPFYAQGSDGRLQAFQLGRDGTVRQVQLPEGAQPIDPLRFVDTGGAMVGVGERSGQPRRILPRTERPGAREDRELRERIAGQASEDRRYAVDNRPGRAAGRGGAVSPATTDVLEGNLTELRNAFRDLNEMGAMVSPERSTGGNLIARARASGPGQLVEGAVGTRAQTLRDRIGTLRPGLLQSIMQATGMTSRQLDSNRELQLYLSTLGDTTASYEANIAAVEGIERFVRANRRAQQQPPAGGGGNRRPARRVQPRSGGNNSGGWGRATVVGN